MKWIYKILVALLIVALVGIGVTACIKTSQALDRGERAIASADEFLARYEARFGRK